jgi:hypothetical protein
MPKVRHRWVCLLGIAIVLLHGLPLAAFADEQTSCPDYERASDSVTIVDERLSEISGLVASRNQPGILWVHNDSGDEAAVYAIDLQGRTVAEVRLIGIDAVDCEDIALGPGPDGDDCLYLADIGDNAAARETICIYRFPEPQIEIREEGQIVQLSVECDVIEAAYPDGPRDAEALLVDPITGDVIVASKDFIHARAYHVPAAVDGAATLEFLLELPWGFMTGGDISSDGTSILLRGYWNAEIWSRSTESDWWIALAVPGCPVPLTQEPQGEAIGFSANGTGYVTISEGIQPPLYLYRALPSDSSD